MSTISSQVPSEAFPTSPQAVLGEVIHKHPEGHVSFGNAADRRALALATAATAEEKRRAAMALREALEATSRQSDPRHRRPIRLSVALLVMAAIVLGESMLVGLMIAHSGFSSPAALGAISTALVGSAWLEALALREKHRVEAVVIGLVLLLAILLLGAIDQEVRPGIVPWLEAIILGLICAASVRVIKDTEPGRVAVTRFAYQKSLRQAEASRRVATSDREAAESATAAFLSLVSHEAASILACAPPNCCHVEIDDVVALARHALDLVSEGDDSTSQRKLWGTYNPSTGEEVIDLDGIAATLVSCDKNESPLERN